MGIVAPYVGSFVRQSGWSFEAASIGMRALQGAIVGTAQWLTIARKLRRSGWYILANMVALEIEAVFSGFLAGFVPQLIVGSVLYWLIRNTVKE